MKRILLACALVLLAGCGGSEETSRELKLKDYEATFRPSDFDPPVSDFFPQTLKSVAKDSVATTIHISQPLEVAQGYRVQIFAATNYDEAMKAKSDAEAQFPDEWFYVVYDAPTYKIRAGNFTERYEADRFARVLSERGYRNAWVVPEKVFKNPPPRQPQPQMGENPPK